VCARVETLRRALAVLLQVAGEVADATCWWMVGGAVGGVSLLPKTTAECNERSCNKRLDANKITEVHDRNFKRSIGEKFSFTTHSKL
jgi:hypothetical protein